MTNGLHGSPDSVAPTWLRQQPWMIAMKATSLRHHTTRTPARRTSWRSTTSTRTCTDTWRWRCAVSEYWPTSPTLWCSREKRCAHRRIWFWRHWPSRMVWRCAFICRSRCTSTAYTEQTRHRNATVYSQRIFLFSSPYLSWFATQCRFIW